jgi:hypothetical protein
MPNNDIADIKSMIEKRVQANIQAGIYEEYEAKIKAYNKPKTEPEPRDRFESLELEDRFELDES